jgi:hypothetical protein
LPDYLAVYGIKILRIWRLVLERLNNAQLLTFLKMSDPLQYRTITWYLNNFFSRSWAELNVCEQPPHPHTSKLKESKFKAKEFCSPSFIIHTMVASKSGIAVGLNKGHITTRRELKAKPSNKIGVCIL